MITDLKIPKYLRATVTLILGDFFSLVKELKGRIRMNINFSADWFTGGTINFSNLYLIFTFHLLPKILP